MSDRTEPADRSTSQVAGVLEVEGLKPSQEPIPPVTLNKFLAVWMLSAATAIAGAIAGLSRWLGAVPGAAVLLLFMIFGVGPPVAWALLRHRGRRRIEEHNRAILAGLPPIAEWETPEGLPCRLTAGGLTYGRAVLCVGRSGFWSLSGSVASDPWLQPSLVLSHDSKEMHWVDRSTNPEETNAVLEQAERTSIQVRLPRGDAGEQLIVALRRDPRVHDDRLAWRSPGGEIALHRNGDVAFGGLEALPAGTRIVVEGEVGQRVVVATGPPVPVGWRDTPPQPGEETRPGDQIRIALPPGEQGERVVRALREDAPLQPLKAALRRGETRD